MGLALVANWTYVGETVKKLFKLYLIVFVFIAHLVTLAEGRNANTNQLTGRKPNGVTLSFNVDVVTFSFGWLLWNGIINRSDGKENASLRCALSLPTGVLKKL
jgi:hypothetical protein